MTSHSNLELGTLKKSIQSALPKPIFAPEFPEAIGDTLKLSDLGGRVDVTFKYPGFEYEPKEFERISLSVSCNSWGAGQEVTPEDANKPFVLSTTMPKSLLFPSSVKIIGRLQLLIKGSNEFLEFVAERTYHVVP